METATTRSILFFTILVAALFPINTNAKTNPTTLPKFSAILLFGDSTLDTGNNNYINPTLAKANKYPYGKDFKGHGPTGRFSNGRLVPDFAASFLGIKDYVPPFLDPRLSNDDIRTGVCFASGGSGYDNLTARISNVIPMAKQIDMFKDYIVRLVEIVGSEEEGEKIIANSFVIISAGTNDFAIDFYDFLIRQVRFDISGYQDFILGKLQAFLEKLYELGCRNLVVAGLPPVGCLPFQMTAKLHVPVRTCLEDQNSDAKAYNNKLMRILSQMEAKLNGSRVLYADIYNPLNELIQNPKKHGFVETKRGCCGTGLVEVAHLCNEQSQLCRNASEFVFFDSIHPTEAACKYMAMSLERDLLAQFYGH